MYALEMHVYLGLISHKVRTQWVIHLLSTCYVSGTILSPLCFLPLFTDGACQKAEVCMEVTDLSLGKI